jgi:hypothetical protein
MNNFGLKHQKTEWILIQLSADGWWKESLNSDGQQFHQYQQSGQPPLTLTHWTQEKIMTYDVGNTGSVLG